jgi:phosphoribosylglycinamide formyltransferase 1
LGNRLRLAVFCSGFGSNFQAIIDAIASKKLNAVIAVMVCDNPAAHALTRARQNQIPVVLLTPKLFKTREAYEKVIVGVLDNEKIDCVVLAGFMRILTPYFVKAYRNRILNIHPSLLPKFKGAHAIRDAFRAGEKETGITVHVVTEDLDAGPILIQKKVRILKTDTLSTLEERIHKTEHELYPKAIEKLLSSKKVSLFLSSGGRQSKVNSCDWPQSSEEL